MVNRQLLNMKIHKVKILVRTFCCFVFACFCLLPSAFAANVQFTSNSIIDLTGLSTTLYALSGSECDSLTVNGSTLTVDIPSASTFTLGTASHNVLGLTPSGGTITLTFDSSHFADGYINQWTEASSDPTATITHTISGLLAMRNYQITANNAVLTALSASTSGNINLTYSNGYTGSIVFNISPTGGSGGSSSTYRSTPTSSEPASTTPSASSTTPIPETTPNITLQEGSLVKSPDSDKVYVIKNNQRFWIPNAQAFEQAGYNWSSIQTASTTLLNLKPQANLIKLADDPKVYVIDLNKILRRHIPNPQVFESYSYDWNNIITVNQAELLAYSESFLVKTSDSPKVYQIKNNQRYYIPSIQDFEAQGFKWDQIMEVNQVEMASYQQGGVISE